MIYQPYNKSVSWVHRGHIITEVWCDTHAVTEYMTKVFFLRRSTINDIVHCVQTTSQNIETYYTTFFKYLHCREKYIYYNTFIKN